MTTYYVSNNTANGYGAGSNNNSAAQAESKLTPWASIGGTTKVPAGDHTVIFNDGVYAGYNTTITQNLTFQAENRRQTTLQTAYTYAFWGAGGDLSLEGFVLDCVNITVAFYRPTDTDITNWFSVIDCESINLLGDVRFFYQITNIPINVLYDRFTMSAEKRHTFFNHHYGTFTVRNCDVADTTGAKIAAQGFFQFDNGEAGSVVDIDGLTGTVSSTTPTFGVSCVNVETVNITNANFTMDVPATISATSAAISVTGTTTPNITGSITDSTFTLSNIDGWGLLLGSETVANNITGFTIDGVTVIGPASPAGEIHGILAGHNSGVVIQNCEVSGCAISIILKECTGSSASGNTIYSSSPSASGMLRTKGAQSGSFLNNDIYTTEDAPCIFIGGGDLTITDNFAVTGNRVFIDAAVTQSQPIAWLANSNVASFSNNVYWHDSGTLPDKFQDENTVDLSLAQWDALAYTTNEQSYDWTLPPPIYSNVLEGEYTVQVLALTNPQNTPEPDGATLTIESNSAQGTLYSYSKTTPFTGTDAENAAEIIANGFGQTPVVGMNTRVVDGQDPLTPHYAGWVQDTEAP